MQELSPTARVILGMLRLGARTGYDIKRYTDVSTRFFWGASYGQIYPELRRLGDAGLVEAEDEPPGGRRRRLYRLTAAGERALHDWLTSPGREFEYRDESLLKLFFGNVLTRDEVLVNLRRMRETTETALATLRGIERNARRDTDGIDYELLALEYGIGLTAWMADWCKATERRLSEAAED